MAAQALILGIDPVQAVNSVLLWNCSVLSRLNHNNMELFNFEAGDR